ncbi:DUF3658 domain-containing protein [Acidocella sp.]|uniref:DUF3658 domain-containing protein n=1 Tax=Acidocella sp. TaxID=50710 RepID=UPI0026168527|nr:DUF3658 domain-containing protein [Acidocella sp.]
MKVLHVAPGHSAAGSLRQALRAAGNSDGVLLCPDDFSCGPVASLSPSARAEWWGSMLEMPEAEAEFAAFWRGLDAWEGKLVLWFGRRSSMELACLHAVAERLDGRSFFVVDVTGLQYPISRRDGTQVMSEPASAVSMVVPGALQALLGTERELDPGERAELRANWRVLVQENSPVRVVGDAGLVSATEDHFDQMLLNKATTIWRKMARMVGGALVSDKVYGQVGDLMLLVRAVALVEQGRLLAKGNPWEMRACEVRLPDASPTG